jgi:hypothetical protein
VARALAEMGVPGERADALATVMIGALEGALLIARAEQDVRALTTVLQELGPLLDAALNEPVPAVRHPSSVSSEAGQELPQPDDPFAEVVG